MSAKLSGAFGMVVTPFTDAPNQPIDRDAFEAIVGRAVEGGLRQIICGAASGEAYELNPPEMLSLLQIAKSAAGGKADIFVSLPWETDTAAIVCDKAMAAGCAGVMTLPETVAYAGPAVVRRLRMLSIRCDKRLMVYAKDVVAVPSDSLLAELAGEGLIMAIKRACDAVPFRTTADIVRKANPDVAIIQGAAERFLFGVVGIADGYTTGTGVVFPKLSTLLETAFLKGDHAGVLVGTRRFEAMELMRAEHNTAYNIAPLKVALQRRYRIGNGKTRPRFMDLLDRDVGRLDIITELLAEAEAEA